MSGYLELALNKRTHIKHQEEELKQNILPNAVAEAVDLVGGDRSAKRTVFETPKQKIILRYRKVLAETPSLSRVLSDISAEKTRLFTENEAELRELEKRIQFHQEQIEALEEMKLALLHSPRLAALEVHRRLAEDRATQFIPNLSFYL
jgi:hypothetical protein